MYQVLKRDGSTMEFDISKISAAMIKALRLFSPLSYFFIIFPVKHLFNI